MKDMGIVQGSIEQAKPLIVNKDTVYVHTDIAPVAGVDEFGEPIVGLFEYHEIQYELHEYLQMMAEQNMEMESQLKTPQEALDFLIMGSM